MIFPKLKTEYVVQVNDRTRLDARDTFVSPDEADITLIEIQAEIGGQFLDITSERYIDWQYDDAQVETITLRVTTDAAPTTITKNIQVLSESEDNLFSSDADLIQYEGDILNYVREGRDSYLDKHRASQKIILDELDSAKVWKRDGSRYTAADLVDIQDFKQWSIFLTLQLIFEGLSNAVDDIFNRKASKYQTMAIDAKSRGVLRLDYNGDGTIDDFEKTDIKTGLLFRQ